MFVQEFDKCPFDKFKYSKLSPINNDMPVGVNETKPIIYLQSVSRFGNVIFEYASLYGIARTADRPAIFVKKGSYAVMVKKLFPCLTITFQWYLPLPRHLETVREHMPNILEKKLLGPLPNKDIRVCCWLESWKYFLPKYSEELKQEFTLSPKLKHSATFYMHRLKTNWIKKQNLDPSEVWNCTYVGVQVRRGDKAIDPGGYIVPNVSYFQKAADYYRNKYTNVIFIVTSDEIWWGKSNLNFKDFVFSISNSEVMDMALLALCNHTIMSVGTFSWWAAWLAGGDAIYYKDHFKQNTFVATFFNQEDYFMPEWIAMTN